MKEMEQNVHEEFRRAMQEAYWSWEPEVKDWEIPKPDLSFLDDMEWDEEEDAEAEEKEPLQMVQEQELDLSFLESKPAKKRHFSVSARRAAAVALAVLVTGGAAGYLLQSEPAYGVKQAFLNVKHLFSPDSKYVDTDTGEERLDIEREADIQKGSAIVPEVYIPQYIPEGFSFEKGTFSNSKEIEYTEYLYVNGKRKIAIDIDKAHETADVSLAGDPYTTKSGKEVYLEEEPDLVIVTYIKDLYIFSVDGAITKEEAIKILDSLQLME